MKKYRLDDYLSHMRQAAREACSFVDGLDKEDFCTDRRTQQAVIINLIIIGEAVTKLMDSHSQFVNENPHIPWRNIRGMRNRIAHGYFDIDLDIVWETLQTALPELLEQLHTVDRGDDSDTASP